MHQQMMIAYGAAGSGGGSLYDEIMADSPAYYFRHSEASGSVMENEVGTDGVYMAGGITLGSAALYAGGPTSVRIPSSGGSGYGAKNGGTLPSLTEITLMTIVQFTSLSAGLRALISSDIGSGADRKWQWRMSGSTMQFIKVAGPQTVQSALSVTTGTPYMLHVTVSSGGLVTFYVNGTSVHSASISAHDYGSVAENIQIGLNSAGAGYINGFLSESAIFPTALSGARVSAHAAAAGF